MVPAAQAPLKPADIQSGPEDRLAMLRDAVGMSLQAVPPGIDPQAVAAYLRAEVAKWTKVIKAGGISLDQ